MKDERIKQGKSLGDIAHRLDYKSRSNYYQYEAGNTKLSVEKFIEFMSAINPELDVNVVIENNEWGLDEHK